MLQQPQTPKLSKAESARINGARSQGPVTVQGQANSANGNLRHGAYSKRILMDGEIPEAYEFFKSAFVDLFLPTDPFETECVESMVTARWRIRRLESTEANNLNIALASSKATTAATFDAIDILHERAVAVQSQMSSIEANTRVQERLHRIYDRNYKLLANYRRKSGCNMPASHAASGPSVSPPSGEPGASSGPPAPASANLTDQPNSQPAANSTTASIIEKAAMVLVIFALLLLTPVATVATMSKTLSINSDSSAFYESVTPARKQK